MTAFRKNFAPEIVSNLMKHSQLREALMAQNSFGHTALAVGAQCLPTNSPK
jgi:hypothetical protein